MYFPTGICTGTHNRNFRVTTLRSLLNELAHLTVLNTVKRVSLFNRDLTVMKFTVSQLALFTSMMTCIIVLNEIQPKTFSINFFLPLCLFCLSLTRGNLKMMMVPLLQENVEKGLWNS